jgi:hypothetical protein
MIGARIFAFLLVAGFCVLYLALKWRLFPAEVMRRYGGTLLAVLGVAFLTILWAGGIFDRRR